MFVWRGGLWWLLVILAGRGSQGFLGPLGGPRRLERFRAVYAVAQEGSAGAPRGAQSYPEQAPRQSGMRQSSRCQTMRGDSANSPAVRGPEGPAMSPRGAPREVQEVLDMAT
eukprot:8505429-Pyramimonas_sp.AAC.1